MTEPAVARRIEVAGWSTVALGFVCLLLAAAQAVLPVVLRQLAEAMETADDPMRSAREAWSSGAASGAVANALFGAALLPIGVAVLRRRRWAHPAMEAACWASIVVLCVLAKPTLAPFFALAGEDASAGRGILVGSVVLLVAQILAVIWFLRFWRKAEVRAEFTGAR
jgi:hypothetical protein